MRNSIMMALFAFTVAGLVMVASPSMAVHKGVGDLTCGTCHTMHSSQGGGNDDGSGFSMGGDAGSFILLRANVTTRADIHLFCLQCHAEEGAQGNQAHAPLDIYPPKVLTTFGYSGAVGFEPIGAGGDFGGNVALDSGGGMGSTFIAGVYTPAVDDDGTNIALGRGHSLGATGATVIPPGNSTDGTVSGSVSLDGANSTLSCTTCHDPHGTDTNTDTINRFRNLKMGSSNPGQNSWGNSALFTKLASSYAGGVGCVAPCVSADGANMGTSIASKTNVWPVYFNGGAQQNAYLIANVNPDSTVSGLQDYVGISLFCSQCHGAWHEDIATGNKHVNTFDWTRHPVNNVLNEAGAAGDSGGGVDIFFDGHFTTPVNPMGKRLPAASAGGTLYTAADGAGTTGADRVFCLSCHFAHGSPYNDILRWDYAVDPIVGNQTAKGVPTNVGCQQCHNR